ncbi:LacI family transcriptional regulator, partial [Arthrobacter deserti]|nr:LacI family transcriptional regulator [Arthrobacter deserti]
MATMADVARVAGVAGPTVSHVLNGTRHASEATRSKVLRAVDETGYRYNSLARSLAVSKTRTIGLSISVLTNPYFGSLVNAIVQRARDEGYTLVLGDSHDDAGDELRVVNSLLDRRVDGHIVAPSPGAQDSTLPVIARAGTPVV